MLNSSKYFEKQISADAERLSQKHTHTHRYTLTHTHKTGDQQIKFREKEIERNEKVSKSW